MHTHTHTDYHTVYGSWANCTSILSGSLVGICATVYFKKALVHTQVTVAYVHLEGGLRWKLSKSKTLLGHLDHIAYNSFYVTYIAMCIWNILWTILDERCVLTSLIPWCPFPLKLTPLTVKLRSCHCLSTPIYSPVHTHTLAACCSCRCAIITVQCKNGNPPYHDMTYYSTCIVITGVNIWAGVWPVTSMASWRKCLSHELWILFKFMLNCGFYK